MKKINLKDCPDDEVFYYGTIIRIKNAHTDCNGKVSDRLFCLITDSNDREHDFRMLDLSKSIGSCIIHDLKPNVKDHHGVDKEAIKTWVKQYFELFYTKEWYEETITDEYLDEIIYIEDLSDYFKQVNRNIKV